MGEAHQIQGITADEEWEDVASITDEVIARVKQQGADGCLLCALDDWDDE